MSSSLGSSFQSPSPGLYLVAAIVMALGWPSTLAWMRFQLRGFQRTEERLTYHEGSTNLARLIPGWLLWIEQSRRFYSSPAGTLMLIIQPGQWMIALGGIVFFGLGAVMFARMLVLQRRLARGQYDAGDHAIPIEATVTGVFKTGRDGRKLFFPWGPRSTSFVIPTQARYWRLRLQVTSYMIVALLLIVGTAIWLPFYVSLGVAVLMGWLYSAWTPRLVRGLPLSAERMSDRNR